MRSGGVLDPETEAARIAAHATGPVDLEQLVERRLAGTPLPLLTGRAAFGGRQLRVQHGVYLPRWTTEAVATAAAERLPAEGRAVDLCTGSGAVAAMLLARRPDAHVVATDIDLAAVRCARANGVDAREGDLFAPLPSALLGAVDVVVAVPPFVPSGEIDALPHDVRRHEPLVALDGGSDGLDLVRRIVDESPRWLRPGGWLVVEVGGDQVGPLHDLTDGPTWGQGTDLVDADGDPCGRAVRRTGSDVAHS